jgi:hypothetical protein
VGLHPGCVYAWKTVVVPGPYDERNKSYLELVDNANDFPDDCFFRVLASRGVVTLRPDEYTPVALNSFIDRCDPNVDIAYATAAHPLPFEPVTLKLLTDTRHPHARGLVPFAMRGSQTKYFYPGSRIQLDNIVVGILSVREADAIVGAATAAAKPAKDELDLMVVRLRTDLAKMKALLKTVATAPDPEGDANAQVTASLGIWEGAKMYAGIVEQKFIEASGAKDKVDAADRANVDLSTIDGYKTAAATAVGEAKTLYEEIKRANDDVVAAVKAAAGGGGPAPGLPEDVFKQETKDKLTAAAAAFTGKGTSAGANVSSVATQIAAATIISTDPSKNDRKDLYSKIAEAILSMAAVKGDYVDAELGTAVSKAVINIGTIDNSAITSRVADINRALDDLPNRISAKADELNQLLRKLEAASTVSGINYFGPPSDPNDVYTLTDSVARANAAYALLETWKATVFKELSNSVPEVNSIIDRKQGGVNELAKYAKTFETYADMKLYDSETQTKLENSARRTMEYVKSSITALRLLNKGNKTVLTGGTTTIVTDPYQEYLDLTERIVEEMGIKNFTEIEDRNFSGLSGNNKRALNAFAAADVIVSHPAIKYSMSPDTLKKLSVYANNREPRAVGTGLDKIFTDPGGTNRGYKKAWKKEGKKYKPTVAKYDFKLIGNGGGAK